FVDGDFITLDCTGSNIGQADAQLSAITGAVFSSDSVVNGGDVSIGNTVDAGVLRRGTSRQLTLTSQPIASTPGATNVCAKIDMYSTNLYAVNGRIAEIDESNNSQCWPITVVTPHRDLVVVPGSVSLSPSPLAPGGLFRAGLPFKIDFDVLNQGNGAVRVNHRDVVHLGASQTDALASNPAGICGVDVSFTGNPPLTGGSTMHESFGLGTGTSVEICKIPFNTPPGDYVLVVDVDRNGSVTETDPNNLSAPAESNNMLVFPIHVDLPLDPQFRVQHKATDPNDQVVEIFGPANGTMYVAAASVRSLTAYSLTLTWSPAKLMYAGTPGGPGDPNRVVFTNFLASRGLAQSCAVTGIDPNAGRLDVSCTTSDPGGGLPARSETTAALFSVTFTPDLPGSGTLVVSNFTAADGSGQPFAALRAANGTFGISGSPDLYVDNPDPPSGVYPGAKFSTSWRVRNVGFGGKTLPLITELVVSRDDVLDFSDPVTPDESVCQYFESSVFPGRSEVVRSVSDCVIEENVRPGHYTGFYEVQLVTDPARRTEATIDVEPRIVSVRARENGGRVVETTGLPDSPGGTAGAVLSIGKR
ncbi:MAG TPA: hypothetical protein VNI57_12500, partial [Candidatus Saccharimonadales bacterium]|nr:hypothetical protein [Candidatus Saccharimonadales bacterium]